MIRGALFVLAGAAGLSLAASGLYAQAEQDATSEPTEEIATLADAFANGEAGLGLRYRYESVEDDAVPGRGRASTLRTTLSYETAKLHGFSLFLEAENVTEVGAEDTFRNAGAGALSNGVTGRAVIADVAQTEFNQAVLAYDSGDFTARIGRQEINLADQRFVGAVGWRQNHQSFDAVSLSGQFNPRVSWGYSYLDRAHRIFGDSRAMSTHLLTAQVGLGDAKLRAYGLELDYDSTLFAGASTRTFGAELAGGWTASHRLEALYELELATQSDTGDNPGEIDAGYAHLMLGAKVQAVTVKLGWEALEGSAADGRFSTPLATLHKFNGWADKFLSTPEAGLVDLYLALAMKRGPWSCAAIYHQFEAESGSADYGDEIDASISWKSDWGQTFALKYADYGADEFSSDTTKWMLWTAYTF